MNKSGINRWDAEDHLLRISDNGDNVVMLLKPRLRTDKKQQLNPLSTAKLRNS